MHEIRPLTDIDPRRFDAALLLKKVPTASRQLAELKGVAGSIPNQGILVNSLGLQEAKDSSAIENIVTTHDQLFRDAAFPENATNAATKEVFRYREALHVGYELVRQNGILTTNYIVEIQSKLEQSAAGFRKCPGQR